MLDEWIGKKVVIELKNKEKYFGVLKEVSDVSNGMVFVSIVDKNNKLQQFALGEILRVEEL